MDATTRNLLVELARTVLRVLDMDSLNPSVLTREDRDAAYRKYVADHPTPWATTVNREADKGTPPALNSQAAVLERLDKKAGAGKPKASKASPHIHTRGMAVRCWDGGKYVNGRVVALSRAVPGKPLTVDVVIDRGPDRRSKTIKVEANKAEILKGAA
jgi:hypothetical protein